MTKSVRIRRSTESGVALAQRFHVSPATICLVRRQKVWKPSQFTPYQLSVRMSYDPAPVSARSMPISTNGKLALFTSARDSRAIRSTVGSIHPAELRPEFNPRDSF